MDFPSLIEPLESRIAPATLSIANLSISEGNSGTKTATFTVSLDANATQDVTFHYATSDNGSAATDAKDGTDYTGVSGDLTIHVGSKTATFDVLINGNTTPEPDKIFNVDLSNAVNATLGTSHATGTILNDDVTTGTKVSVSDVTLTEGSSGTKNAVFTISFDTVQANPVVIHYYTADGTGAAAGTDYKSTVGDITIPAGSPSVTVNVPVIGNTTVEANKTFTFNIDAPGNATVNNTTGTGTILNDDVPAANISADHTQFTYTDIDGDLVTVKSSAPIFTSADTVNKAFQFQASATDANKLQLQGIDYTKLDSKLQVNSNLTFTVTQANGGDGLVNVGFINSATDLGSITIPGDLGKITVGDANAKTKGLTLLDVKTIGTQGTSTGASDLSSTFNGPVGTIHVRGDVTGAYLGIADVSNVTGSGSLSLLQIDGILTGGSSNNTGEVAALGKIGSAIIGGITGGDGTYSGLIYGGLGIDSMHLIGALTGGSGANSGAIFSTKLGVVTLDHGIVGGSGTSSGLITGTTIFNLTIAGTVAGGTGSDSGEISTTGKISSATVGGFLGGAGTNSGSIISSAQIANLHVLGSVTGGTDADSSKAANSGEIKAPTIGTLTLDGALSGGSGSSSGLISANTITSLKISGGISGGSGSGSGEVQFNQSLGTALIDSITGGVGQNSGSIQGNYNLLASIGTLTVNHSVLGGAGQGSGVISASTINNLTIGGDLHGGSGTGSGAVQAGISFVKGHIVGSVIGGDSVDDSHTAASSGQIVAGSIGSLTIDQFLKGGTGALSGVVSANTISNLTITGGITGGDGDSSGNVLFSQSLGKGSFGEITGGAGVKSGGVRGATMSVINSATVTHAITGGNGAISGGISAGTINTLVVGSATAGDGLIGGEGAKSGFIAATTLGKAHILGSVTGGNYSDATLSGTNSGQIAVDNISSLTIDGDVSGGSGLYSGMILSANQISYLKIHGSLIGGTAGTAAVAADPDANPPVTAQAAQPGYSGSVLAGKLGTVIVDGSITGGNSTSSTSTGELSGSIFGDISIGSLTVGGSISGGSATNSGLVQTPVIGNVSVGGDIHGGTGVGSGRINIKTTIAKLQIGGSVIGNTADDSGEVVAQSGIQQVTVGGSLEGNSGFQSGSILAINSSNGALSGSITNATIKGDVSGGSGNQSGGLAAGAFGKVTINGNLTGGGGTQSGVIFSNSTIDSVSIGGGITGDAGALSGAVITNQGRISVAKVGGTIQGGSGDSSGFINSDSIGTVTVGGKVKGGIGPTSGSIHSDQTAITSLSIGGLEGGSGTGSGTIAAKGLSNAKIAGDVLGGTGDNSGSLSILGGDIKGLTLNNLTGGSGNGTGAIITDGVLSNVKILQNVTGGNSTASQTLSKTGYIQARQIASLTVGGSIVAGTNNGTALYDSGTIRATQDILSLNVGSLSGSSTNHVVISAAGFPGQPSSLTTDVAIKSLNVSGNVSGAEILAGYGLVGSTNPNVRGTPINGDAQIGNVVVGGNWSASSLVAGVIAGSDNNFGDLATINNVPNTTNDQVIDGSVVSGAYKTDMLSKISSVIIKGTATGSTNSAENFGIVAQYILSAKIHGVAVPLTPGFSNDSVHLAGANGNFNLNEQIA